MGLGYLHQGASMRLKSAILLGSFARVAGISLPASLALLFCGCLPPVVASSQQPKSIVIPLTVNPPSPTMIDLGDIEDGSRRIERAVVFENRNGAPVTIVRIESTCDCVSFEGALATFRTNESTPATVVVDVRSDRDFKGSLGVPVTGLDVSGRRVFEVVICARVEP